MNERERIKNKFLVDCTDRQNAACTHGPKGRHERCISCVVEQAVADISALRQQQGEFICRKCLLRQDAPTTDAEVDF